MKIAALLAMLIVGSTANAALLDRGSGLLYDDVLRITWTQNAGMTDSDWEAVRNWASDLTFGGYSDWRLPWASVTTREQAFAVVDCGSASEAACRDNELGYMYFYNLGEGSSTTIAASGVQGLRSGSYWTGTKRVETSMWYFNLANGTQNFQAGGVSLNAWAVRDGDVSPVPEPIAAATMLVGLGLSAGALRLRRSRRRGIRIG